jgi:hypothetical protein
MEKKLGWGLAVLARSPSVPAYFPILAKWQISKENKTLLITP